MAVAFRLVCLLGWGLIWASAAPGRPPALGDPAVAILSDDPCGPARPDEIRACRPRILRDDVLRLHDYATCLVAWQRRSGEAAVLGYLRRGDTAGLAALAARDHSCPRVRIRVSGVLFAGALAEALLADRRSAPPPAAPPPDCLLAAGQAESLRLIAAPPLSRREGAAFEALAARLPPCIAAGQTVRFSPLVLRAAVALHLFAAVTPDAVAATSGTVDLASLGTPALDLAPGLASLPATPALRLQVPLIVPEGTGPAAARRLPPMTGEPWDPEELLANEAQPHIDPNTGEEIQFRPQRGERRDRGDPY